MIWKKWNNLNRKNQYISEINGNELKIIKNDNN